MRGDAGPTRVLSRIAVHAGVSALELTGRFRCPRDREVIVEPCDQAIQIAQLSFGTAQFGADTASAAAHPAQCGAGRHSLE